MKYIRIILISIFVFNNCFAKNDLSNSTSTFVNVKYKNTDGTEGETCVSGDRASLNNSYVSMRVEKIRVFQKSKFKHWFRKNRKVFAGATATLTLDQKEYATEKMSPSFIFEKSTKRVDIPTGWTLFNKVPWIISNGNIKVNIGYSSESLFQDLITDFSSLTKGVGITLNSTISGGLNVITIVEKLANKDKGLMLLNYTNEIPLSSFGLCSGRYVVFASPDADVYQPYLDSSEKLFLNNNVLKFDNENVNDVSYIVISVGVDGIKYNPVGLSQNAGTLWSKLYAEAMEPILLLSSALPYLKDNPSIYNDEVKKKLKSGFSKIIPVANKMLDGDITLLQSERIAIKSHYQSSFYKILTLAEIKIGSYTDQTSDAQKVSDALAIVNDLSSMGYVTQERAQMLRGSLGAGDLQERVIDVLELNSQEFDFNNIEEFDLQDRGELDIQNIQRQDNLDIQKSEKQDVRAIKNQLENAEVSNLRDFS